MAVKDLKKEEGVTITVLALTVIIMFILAGVSLNAGFTTIKDMRVGRIVSYMNLVKAKVQIINENYSSYNYDDSYLTGSGPYTINNIENVNISRNEINLIAQKAGVSSADVENWNWYKWDKNNLIEQKLDENMLGDNEFFYVNYEHGEIIYTGKTERNGISYYSLTGLNEAFKQ